MDSEVGALAAVMGLVAKLAVGGADILSGWAARPLIVVLPSGALGTACGRRCWWLQQRDDEEAEGAGNDEVRDQQRHTSAARDAQPLEQKSQRCCGADSEPSCEHDAGAADVT